MTGTAQTEAAEFSNIYKLEVTEVPTNRTIDRTDNPDVVFRTETGAPGSVCFLLPVTSITQQACTMQRLARAGKWAATVTEIKLFHRQGRPVLVGTTSVERSEALAAMLQQEGAYLRPAWYSQHNVQR